MSTNKWVYRVVDGQWCLGLGPDPSIYLTDQINYGLADIGESAPTPDPRTQKWNGITVVAKTQAEIDIYDEIEQDRRAARIDNEVALQALASLDFEERQKLQVKPGQKLLTTNECKQRMREIYRSLL